MGVITTPIPEIHLSMLNNRVVPIRNIDCSVRPHLDVNGTEGPVGRGDQILDLGGNIGSALVGETKTIDSVTPEIGRKKSSYPVFRHVPTRHNLQPAVLRLPRIKPAQDPRCSRRRHPYESWKNVVDTITSRSIGHKALPPFVEDMAPRIHQALHENLEPPGLGAEVPHPPSQKSPHTVRGLHVAVNVDRLIHPEVSSWTPAKRMKQVMSILGPKT